jgi:hypothetical protein
VARAGHNYVLTRRINVIDHGGWCPSVPPTFVCGRTIRFVVEMSSRGERRVHRERCA